jgi:hypothetical protein
MTEEAATAPPAKTIIISSAVANEKYPRVLGMKTPGGSPIRDCGDRVAVALRGTGRNDWFEIAQKNGIRGYLEALEAAGKNTGQVRMALGRMLRARLIKHEADPAKNPEPYLPEPTPMPVKAKTDPNPPREEPEEGLEDMEDEVEDDEEETKE